MPLLEGTTVTTSSRLLRGANSILLVWFILREAVRMSLRRAPARANDVGDQRIGGLGIAYNVCVQRWTVTAG